MSHRAKKRFGQHFLHDPWIIQRIVDAIDPQPGQTLIEIGPGPGALTEPVLRRAGRLIAVELDRDLIPVLQRRLAGVGELQLIQADALRHDFAALATAAAGPLRLIGNLPYNISTPLLFHLYALGPRVQDMHFMLQKEVVDRLAAGPGGKDYGRLSLMTQYHCAVEPLLRVPPGAFTPPPRVDSAVVRLRPHPRPPVEVADPQQLAALIAAAFNQRRKTLRNSLRPWLDEDRLRAAGVDPGERPERLDLAAFAALANAATPPA